MPVSSELCSDASCHFFHENDQKQTKVTTRPATRGGQSGNCPPLKFSQMYVFVRCSNTLHISWLLPWSRLSDSNMKNCLLLSVTNLPPNITGLVKAKRCQKSHKSHSCLLCLCIKLFLFKTANCVHILLLVLSEIIN